MTSSASWLALRVAQLGFSVATLVLKAAIASSTTGGMSPFCRRSNSTRSASGMAAWRLVHLRRADLPRAPTLRQAVKIGSGISNGGEGQPSFWRAPPTPFFPDGGTGLAALPPLVRAPLPL